MKVFNLACEHGHAFEGWFASAEDYDSQLARGLLECPACASRAIRKMPSAPRLNLTTHSGEAAPSSHASSSPVQAQAMMLKLAREILANTEDVGARFAEEARRIHYKEAPERGIRGQASAEEARALADEGIEVMAVPMPALLKEPLQ
ncbi:MAG: hypothetical protein RLZ51_1200 [Pseudomonadota bacterium]